jgi:hypothetical protein
MTTEERERPSRAKYNKAATFTDPDHYPAVSAHQPYAGLIWLAGSTGIGKDLEIRPMRLNQRGPIVICAGKHLDKEAYQRVQRILVGGGIMRLPEYEAACGPAHCGKAVALFDMVDCRPMQMEDHDVAYTSPNVMDVAEQFAWVADRITALRPFDWTGAQGFFRVPRTLVDAALDKSTTREQRIELRAKMQRKLKKKLCPCGRSFPDHLAEFMNKDPRSSHVCQCGTKYVVKGMRFVVAEAGTEVQRGA